MTPQEKAIELYTKYDNLCRDFTKGVSIKEMAKECALIAVNEIYKLRLNIGQHSKTDEDKENYYSYWEEVKQEIEKL